MTNFLPREMRLYQGRRDAKSYQRLLDLAERLETIQAVREGLESMRKGEGRPLDDVFVELEEKLRPGARQ